MKRLFFLLIIGITLGLAARYAFFEGIYIATDSMAPTLPKGTHVFVNRFARFYRVPVRGDIIVFKSPVEPGKGLVKRVIAVKNDTLEIKDKEVFLNGKKLEEDYTQFIRSTDVLEGDNIPPIIVPPGYMFVMGDNRDVSKDSRDFKSISTEWLPFVPVTAIEGYITPP
jgi:signal peptidase I